MKTLHRVYLRNYYKSVAVCYLCTGLFLVVFTFATGLLKAIGAALCVSALLAPMFFLNNQFYRNIPHLINRPYSKKELLLFFLLERTIKASSTFFPLIIAVSFMDTLESPQIGHYELYILISSFLIFNYVLPTIGLKKTLNKSFYNLYYKKYKSKITYIILSSVIIEPQTVSTYRRKRDYIFFTLCIFCRHYDKPKFLPPFFPSANSQIFSKINNRRYHFHYTFG